jgi:hypothetical protein
VLYQAIRAIEIKELVYETDWRSQFTNIDKDKMRRKVAKVLRKKSQIVVQIEGTIWRVVVTMRVLTGSNEATYRFSDLA